MPFFHGWKHREEQLPSTYTEPLAFAFGTTLDGELIGNTPYIIGVDLVSSLPTLGAGDSGKKYILTTDKKLYVWDGSAWDSYDSDEGWLFHSSVRNEIWIRYVTVALDGWFPLSYVMELEMSETAPSLYYVDDTNGSDTDGNGTYYRPWATLQKAVNEIGVGGAGKIVFNNEGATQDVSISTGSYITIMSHGAFEGYDRIGTLTLGDGAYVFLNNIELTTLDAQSFVNYIFMEEGAVLTSFVNSNSAVKTLLLTRISNTAWTSVSGSLGSSDYAFLRRDDGSNYTHGGALNLGSNQLKGLADGTDSTDALTKAQIETAIDGDITAHVAEADPHTQYQKESEKNTANGYAGLDASSKILASQLPDLALSEYMGNFTDTTTALADAGVQASQRGDWFTVDSNGGESWIVTSDNPTLIGDITKLATPTDAVTSVFGRTGAVVAQDSDYDASQVDADTTNFDHSLTALDDDAQKALDTLDDKVTLVFNASGAVTNPVEFIDDVAYTTGGYTHDLGNKFTDISKPPVISVTPRSTGTTFGTDLITVAIAETWNTDHWEVAIQAHVIEYDSGPPPSYDIRSAETGDIDLHIIAKGGV